MKNPPKPLHADGHGLSGTPTLAPLALAAALFGVATGAYAQETPESGTQPATKDDVKTPDQEADKSNTKKTSSADVEEVLIVGTRASLESAINRKKKASTVVDSIVAEDIASFPDKNIGEALQRITGVQLSRDFGEGTQVSIRGVEPDLNRVEINGTTVLGNGGSGQRGADFRELASELVKSIDVFKGFTASMTEGGVGGTVSIETIKPLDLEKPLFAGTMSEQYLDTTDTWHPRANLTTGSKFFGDRFGALLNVTYDRNDTRGDYLRNTEWVRLADFDSATNPGKTVEDPLYSGYDTYDSCSALTDSTELSACRTQFYDYSPRIPRYGVWIREDKRTSAMATLQYQLTDKLDVYLEGNYNERDNHLIDYNYTIDLTSATRYQSGTVTTDANHNVTSLTTAETFPTATTGAYGIFGSAKRDFAYHQDSKYLSSGFTYNGDKLLIKGLAGTSKGTTVGDTNNISISASIPGIGITLNPKTGVPYFSFPEGYDPQSIDTYSSIGPSLQYRPTEVTVTEDQGKLDFDYTTDWTFLSHIKTGAQYRKSRSLSYAGGGYLTTDGVTVPSANVTTNVSLGTTTDLSTSTSPIWSPERLHDFLAASQERTPGKFFDAPGFNRSGLPNNWLAMGYGAVPAFFDVSGFDHDSVRNAIGTDGLSYKQIPAFDITETIDAEYLQGDFETSLAGKPILGNFGLRYVTTKDDALGSNTIRQYRQSGTTDLGDPVYETVVVGSQILTIHNEYHDALPSVNVTMEFTPTLQSRIGWAKVMARPKPTDLVPNSNCLFDVTDEGLADDEADTCSAGNPDLKPYRADQYDINLTWYANKDTMLSAALFYKDIKTYILASTTVTGVDFFHDGVLYDVKQPINGSGAQIGGIELSAQTAFTFLPYPFNGLGVVLNYTGSDAKDVGLYNSLNGEELSFPGLSKSTYNAILYYDQGPLNVRFAYNRRSKWLSSAAERSGNPSFRDGSAYLDAKATWRFLDTGWSMFVEGKNLTGETERTTSGDIRMGDLSYSGRRYFAGVSWKY